MPSDRAPPIILRRFALRRIAIIIACLLLGFLLGAFSAWLSGAGARRKVRALGRMNDEKARQISQLHRDISVHKQAAQQPKPPSITHAA